MTPHNTKIIISYGDCHGEIKKGVQEGTSAVAKITLCMYYPLYLFIYYYITGTRPKSARLSNNFPSKCLH